MSLFDPQPSYRTSLPGENAGFALGQPLNGLRNFGEQFQAGALDTFGLGPVVRDLMTPRGMPNRAANPLELNVLGTSPIVGGLIAGYEAARPFIGVQTSGSPMTAEEYSRSPYYRKEIPYDAAMTDDRAASLAAQFDIRQARQFYGAKDMATTLLGNFAGGAIDPINYVPIFGQFARTAAALKFGYVVGHALIGASEAAINTAVFGALTSADRARYGDDVSWQAAINNIAFSALAGGAFGGFAGVVGRVASARALKAEQRARMSTETVSNIQSARGVLNDAVASLIDTGDVRLSKSSHDVLQRITTEVIDKREAARALDTETAGVAGTKPGEVVITPSGARVEVRPEVVELASLKAATGAFQVRDRASDNAGSTAQIEDIAINLDPARLMPNVDASQGAPLVGPDDVVDSGNGRVAAIGRAYEAYPAKAAAYKQALVDAGHADAAGMQQPVLIQRRVTPLSPDARAQFNADANSSSTARMSAVELAAMDRGALTDTVMNGLDDSAPVTAASNRGFVAGFLRNLPLNERNALVAPDGALNADGQRRIENALVAAAYGDVDATALRKFAEATDDNTRAVVGALADVAPRWAAMRRAAARGEISPEYDMTPELTEALRKLSAWREQAAAEKRPVGTVIREGLGQGDILSGEMSAPTKLFVRMFYTTDEFSQVAGRDTIAGRLDDLVRASMDLGQPDMLGEAYAATKLGVLKGALGDLKTDVLETTGLPSRNGALGEAGTRPGISQGGAGDRRGIGKNSGDRAAGSIASRMAARFQAAGRPAEEAHAAGALVDSFYATQAQRLGISTGELEARFGLPEVRQGVGAASLPDEVLFQPAPPPDSPEFNRWFGASKVVDEHGAPLAVHHATWDDFQAFDPKFSGRNTDGNASSDVLAQTARMGFWFSDQDITKAMLAPRTVDAFLRLENPKEYGSLDELTAAIENAGGTADALRDQLRGEGHDGVVVQDEEFGGRSYVAFDPTQIKSTANRGTFDPNDPRILFQPAYHGTPHIFDKFDSSKIGTGEGAQAFGHGLYFAGRKEVAQHYRRALSEESVQFPDGSHFRVTNTGEVDAITDKVMAMLDERGIKANPSTIYDAFNNADTSGGNDIPIFQAAIKALEDDQPSNREQVDLLNQGIAYANPRALDIYRDTEAAIAALKAIAPEIKQHRGRLLIVDIPHDDELLSWDRPLSEQPEAIRKKIKTALAQRGLPDPNEATGEQVYNAIQMSFRRAEGGMRLRDAAAETSKALHDAGIPGLRYLDQQSRDAGEGTHNYVIFDDSRVNVTGFEQTNRGAIQFGDTGSIITMLERADASTAVHELGHHFLSMLKSLAERPDAPDAISADWQHVTSWWADNADDVAKDSPTPVTGDDVRAVLTDGTTGDHVKDLGINVAMQEQWARAFEGYARTGEAPTEGLRGAFAQFKDWLSSVYRSLTDLNVKLSDDIRGVFDSLLGGEQRGAAPDAGAQRPPASVGEAIVDLQEPRDEPPIPGLDVAAARVGKIENNKALAEQHGVDPESGDFSEIADIDAMREAGQLTAADEELLAAGDQVAEDGAAYSEALRAASACVTR